MHPVIHFPLLKQNSWGPAIRSLPTPSNFQGSMCNASGRACSSAASQQKKAPPWTSAEHLSGSRCGYLSRSRIILWMCWIQQDTQAIPLLYHHSPHEVLTLRVSSIHWFKRTFTRKTPYLMGKSWNIYGFRRFRFRLSLKPIHWHPRFQPHPKTAVAIQAAPKGKTQQKQNSEGHLQRCQSALIRKRCDGQLVGHLCQIGWRR